VLPIPIFILAFSLVLGIYEIVTGKIPGGQQKSFLYQWANSSITLRIVATIASLIILRLIFLYKPESHAAYISAFIGAFCGLVVIGNTFRRK
jgi:hypothetical protein